MYINIPKFEVIKAMNDEREERRKEEAQKRYEELKEKLYLTLNSKITKALFEKGIVTITFSDKKYDMTNFESDIVDSFPRYLIDYVCKELERVYREEGYKVYHYDYSKGYRKWFYFTITT